MSGGDFSDVARRACSADAVRLVLSAYDGRTPNPASRLACPVHEGENDNFVVLERGFHCHVCGASGSAVELARLLFFPARSDREGRIDALRWLAPRLGVALGAAPAGSPPAPRGTEAARTLAWLAAEGVVSATPADIYHGIAAAWREIRSAGEWEAFRALLLESWLPAELERAGLWKQGALALPEVRPSRVRLRCDSGGAPTGLYFLTLTGVGEVAA